MARVVINSYDGMVKRQRKALAIKEQLQKIYGSIGNKDFVEFIAYAVDRYVKFDDKAYLDFARALKQPFVGIETFIDSKDFLGATDLTLWPEVRRAAIELNKYWWKTIQDGAYTEGVFCGGTGTGKCTDFLAQFLTPKGWKYIGEYEKGDLVAQYHADGTVDFVEPLEYVDQPADGFYHVKNKCTDQKLTSGHRFIYRSPKTGELYERQVDDIAVMHNKSIRGFKGQVIAGFNLHRETSLRFSNEQLRVLVAVIADGSFYKMEGYDNLYKCRVRVKKQRKVDRLIDLLDKARIKYSMRAESNDFTVISFTSPARVKDYATFWSASPEQLRIIVDEVFYWDGDITKQKFRTCVRESADFIQYAITSTGRRATLTYMDRTSTKGHIEYVVNAMDRDYFTLANNGDSKTDIIYEEAQPGERCYCFKVPTSMWVARRNDKVFVTGNTELAKVTLCYRLHIMGCMRSVQEYYGLPKATIIAIPVQAAKPNVTKKVIYTPIRSYVDTMPWFQVNMRPDEKVESEMFFKSHNIRMMTVGADGDAILGEAILAGLIDEANFMKVVTKSKKAAIEVGSGRTSTYDQAQNAYDTMTRRKKGRFLKRGPEIGLIIVASSTRYRGDFTDKRLKHIEEVSAKGVFVYRKSQYDVRPKSVYSGEVFRVHIDDTASMEVRILRPDEFRNTGEILEVPIEYLDDFQKDASGALRDICGRSTISSTKFFKQPHKILECMDLGRENGLTSLVTNDNVILGFEGMPRLIRDAVCKNRNKPRFFHVDLAVNSCRVGLAMVRFDGLININRDNGGVETLPYGTLELAVSIEPDQDTEIDISAVRVWVKQLKTYYGYPIVVVGYDQWGSIESKQAWRKEGMIVAQVSTTHEVYKAFRDAVYDGRLAMYDQPLLYQELTELELDEKANSGKGKVDHPPGGQKDLADAVASAYYIMLSSPSSWVMPSGDGRHSNEGRISVTNR